MEANPGGHRRCHNVGPRCGPDLVAHDETSAEAHTWRAIHLTSYATFWLASLHGTFAGTDAGQPLYVATSTTAVLAVAGATTYRILNGRKTHRRQPKTQSPELAQA